MGGNGIMWNPFKKELKQVGGIGFFMPTVTEPFGISTYESFAFEAYQRNSTANACVNWISRAIADLPIKVFTEKIVNGEVEEVFINDHPVWRFIGEDGMPNRDMSWGQFNDAYWTYRHIDGNNYLFGAGDVVSPGELFLLRPDRVEIKTTGDPAKPIASYDYTVNGEVKSIPPEQILHTRTFNPLNDFYGQPILLACATEIDQVNAANLWNYSLLKNGARPSLFGSAPQGAPSPDPAQMKQLREWANNNATGAVNAGKMIIMPGIDLKEVGLSPKDMDHLKGVLQAMVSISNTCGVPPELIGIQDQKTYSNYQEARKAFYEETILPYADDFFKSLTRFFRGKFQTARNPLEAVTIAVDKERVKALQEAQDSQHQRVREDIKGSLLTINEARAEIGFDEVEGGDVMLTAVNQAPLDEIAGADSDNEVMPAFEGEEEEIEDENN